MAAYARTLGAATNRAVLKGSGYAEIRLRAVLAGGTHSLNVGSASMPLSGSRLSGQRRGVSGNKISGNRLSVKAKRERGGWEERTPGRPPCRKCTRGRPTTSCSVLARRGTQPDQCRARPSMERLASRICIGTRPALPTSALGLGPPLPVPCKVACSVVYQHSRKWLRRCRAYSGTRGARAINSSSAHHLREVALARNVLPCCPWPMEVAAAVLAQHEWHCAEPASLQNARVPGSPGADVGGVSPVPVQMRQG